MGHEQEYIRQDTGIGQSKTKAKSGYSEDFVLEKSIFNNVFEKDIRRVYIYKKAERLAKAIHLIAPAFKDSMSLRNRVDSIAIGLVDAAILSHSAARTALSRELLTLSSVLSIARTGGMLSSMNAELIGREAQALLQEVAHYEEPRLFLDETPTLSALARKALPLGTVQRPVSSARSISGDDKRQTQGNPEGHLKDRRETILSVIKDKKKVSIKDISTIIRNISEKTIQRELASLVELGTVVKEGERRWSIYSLKSA